MLLSVVIVLGGASATAACLLASETATFLSLQNDRLFMSVNKTTGAVDMLTLDGQDLLGVEEFIPNTPGGSTGNGRYGIGPYLDCYCVPSGSYTPGSIAPTYRLIESNDGSYGGIVMSEIYPETGQLLEMYWFLRDGETGLHTFARLAYNNATTPFLRNLQEFRTLFRPQSGHLWTHLVTDDSLWAPLPVPNPASGDTTDAVTVQDATWDLRGRTNDPYVEQFSDYYTKYTFAAQWRDQQVHGLFGATATGNSTKERTLFGAWLVMNTKDTYFGGPLHSDLVVDGIVYNYYVSNHHGAGTPNITDGFDRTFGPQYYHFNSVPEGRGSDGWRFLRNEAVQLASPDWNIDFYDTISPHVPNYVPSSGRGRWTACIHLPVGALRAIAILAQDGVDVQDNVQDPSAYQYWADVGVDGRVTIDRVKAATYRLTIYADGIFGDYTQDSIVVREGQTTNSGVVVWKAESAGVEVWRLGTPDHSSGEWRHGNTRDPDHQLHPPEYRIYFGAYDFLDDFPGGVRFRVGHSKASVDWNYIHWSVFGGYANSRRPDAVAGVNGQINNWTLEFDLEAHYLIGHRATATFTVQLAGAKTAAGNTDAFNASQPWANMQLGVAVNGLDLEPWVIPYYHSSSCGVRSGVSCYQLAHKFVFPADYLQIGTNEMVLSLPYNATDYESAVMPQSVYVQYDALRLEVQ